MKSFDILLDRRLIQSDLIVVNLPIRNDIAAYYWLELDSRLINHIIAEKAVLPVENAGDIAFGATADSAVAKYERIDAQPIVLDANAEFQVLYPLSAEEHGVEIQSEMQETAQKFERVFLPISVGADDMLDVMPMKAVGDVANAIVFDITASEVKNSIIDGATGQVGPVMKAVLGDPFAVYYESANGAVDIGADVKSLGYLRHLRLIKNSVHIGVDSIDFDLYRSLGKCAARIAVGVSNVSFAVEFFIDTEAAVEPFASAEVSARKTIDSESSIVLTCAGAAVLRRMRLLSEIDAIGTLSDANDMSLEEMYYTDI